MALESHEEAEEVIETDSEDELVKNNEGYHPCVIPLHSRFKHFWDHLQLPLMIYVATLVPFRMSFLAEFEIPVWAAKKPEENLTQKR